MNPAPKMIMTINDDAGLTVWRLACGCTSSDCDATLWIEETVPNEFELGIEMKVKWSVRYRYSSAWRRLCSRVRSACAVLFCGWLDMSGGIVLNKDNAMALHDVTLECLRRMGQSATAHKGRWMWHRRDPIEAAFWAGWQAACAMHVYGSRVGVTEACAAWKERIGAKDGERGNAL